MKRYEKFVLEAEKGITFEVSEGTSGELIIRAQNIATANVYSTNYVNPPIPEVYVNPPIPEGYRHVCGEWNNGFVTERCSDGSKFLWIPVGSYVDPPIPEGYKHVCGEWNNGFVIERCSDRSQFVWIPVGSLDSNGTLDGENFSEKFGRRNYMNNGFSDNENHEDLNGELLEQLESVKKYGGFYISRYNISVSSAGELQSVKGVMPLLVTNYANAKSMASTIEDSDAVKSHLPFGAEYDSVLEWFIKTKVRTLAEIAEDSSEWGNYGGIRKKCPRKVVETGSREKWCSNNIYDFAGNVSEWTQEQWSQKRNKNFRYIFRGGDFQSLGYLHPVAHRDSNDPNYDRKYIGFRATLYIK